MNWYQTLEDCSLQHCGQDIKPGLKILLSIEQAELHNAYKAQVIKCDPPTDVFDAAVTSEYEEWKAVSPVVEDAVSEVLPSQSSETRSTKSKK
jgi:hypothetical protein